MQYFNDFDKEAPKGFIKNHKRYPTEEENKAKFRVYGFQGQTKIPRSKDSIIIEPQQARHVAKIQIAVPERAAAVADRVRMLDRQGR